MVSQCVPRDPGPDPANPDGHGREPLCVLIVDDHRLVRLGIAVILEACPGLRVVGEAGTAEEALRLAHELRPDVVLMDVHLPGLDGIAATSRMTRELPGVRVVGLSMLEVEHFGAQMRGAGACACLSKAAGSSELCAAVRRAGGRGG